VAKRRDTLDDLLLRNGDGITAFAKNAGIPAFTLLRLRRGDIEAPRIATLTKLAKALGVDVARVRAACEASRDAASK
jgi:predicted transcriptional regulator